MDDKYQKDLVAVQQIHKRARFLRGRFLNTVAVIERDVARILTKYFCVDDDEKRNLFFTRIAESLSLNRKKDILLDMLKNDHPSYFESRKQDLAELRNIQEFRNKLAHSVVDVSPSALERPIEAGVSFVQWRQGGTHYGSTISGMAS